MEKEIGNFIKYTQATFISQQQLTR